MTKGGTGTAANGTQYSGTEAERKAIGSSELNFRDEFYVKTPATYDSETGEELTPAVCLTAYWWDGEDWVYYMDFDVSL